MAPDSSLRLLSPFFSRGPRFFLPVIPECSSSSLVMESKATAIPFPPGNDVDADTDADTDVDGSTRKASKEVGWDESTAGEKHYRVSLWEIEPLTTFPMYPSLFPLRLKHPWHPGAPLSRGNKEDEGSGFIWPRGDSGEWGIQSLSFQSLGMGPLVQQSLEPLMLGNEFNLCQAISAAALQEIRGGDFLMQQFLQYQQPFSFPQQSCGNGPLLQQQIFQQALQEQIVMPQSQSVTENLAHSVSDQQLQRTHNEQQKQQVQQPQTYAEAFHIPNNHMQQQQSPLPPQLHKKSVFPDSSLNFSPAAASGCIQGLLGSSYSEGNATILGCSRLGNPIISEQNQQPWEPRFTLSQVTPFGSTVMLPSFAAKDTSVESENCSNLQNHTLYGIGKDLHSSLSTAVPNIGISGTDNDISTVPYAASCFQNSLYGYLDGSSGSLQNAAEIDPATRTFVKVYKSGSVGRSLDITLFSSYDELRQELGQMFGIEGLLNDPLRSGWQLVFVDRENDVLLLGDDPWESFVNNVWYIKILSPEDVLKMGKQGVQSFG